MHNAARPGIKAWLASCCRAIGSSDDRPVPVNYFDIHIGNTSVHHSHRLYKISGLVYCNRCGAYARKRVQKLAEECIAPTSAGESLISLVKRGKILDGKYRETRFSNTEIAAFHNIEETIKGLANIAQIEGDCESVDVDSDGSSINMDVETQSHESGSD